MSDRAAVQRLIENRYHLIESFPPGHTGIAWLATDTASMRDVVIKLPKLEGDPVLRRQNKRELEFEIQALKLLQPSCVPPVVELIDAGTFRYLGNEEYPYFVTAQAKGDNLYALLVEWMRDGRRIPYTEMLEIFDTLLETLEKAHHLDLIYNDVDIKHVFWDSSIANELDSATQRMEIIDWGNARLASDPDLPSGISFKEDVYQCGQFLHKAFTGLNILDLEDIDPSVANLIRKIEAKSFSTMGELRSEVKPLLKQRYAQLDSLINQLADEYANNSLHFRNLVKNSSNPPQQTSIEAYRQSLENTLDKLDQVKAAKHRCYNKLAWAGDKILRQSACDFITAFANFDEVPNQQLLNYAKQYTDRMSALNASQQSRLQGLAQYVWETANHLHHFTAIDQRDWFMAHVVKSWQEMAEAFSQPSVLAICIDQTAHDFLTPYSDLGDFEAWREQAQLTSLLLAHLNKPTEIFDIVLLEDLGSPEHEEPLRAFHAHLSAWFVGGEPSRKLLSAEFNKLSPWLNEQGNLLNARIVAALQQYEELGEPEDQMWDINYWHRPTITRYTNSLAEVCKVHQSLRERLDSDPPLNSSADLEQWVKKYKGFFRQWHSIVGLTSKIQEQTNYLTQTEKCLAQVRQAIDEGNTAQAKTNLHALRQNLRLLVSDPASNPAFFHSVAHALNQAEVHHDPRLLPITVLANNVYEKAWTTRQQICGTVLHITIGNEGLTESQRAQIAECQEIIPAAHIFEPLSRVCTHLLLPIHSENIGLLSKDVQDLPESPLRNSLEAYIKRFVLHQQMLALSSFEAINDFLATNTDSDLPVEAYEQLKSLEELHKNWSQLDFEHSQRWEVDSTWLADLPSNAPLPSFIQQVQSVHSELTNLREQLRDYRRRSVTAIEAHKAITRLPEFQGNVFHEIDQRLQRVSIQEERLVQWRAIQDQFNTLLELISNSPDSEVPPVLVEIVQQAKKAASPLLMLYETALKQYPPLWQYWLRHNAQRLITRMGRRGLG